MKIDRAVQLQILQNLAEVYPNGIYPLKACFDEATELEVIIANTKYLHEHGLVASGFADREFSDMKISERWSEPRETFITAAGIDFLRDDGGLGAILGVVTVRLESATIMALVANRIEQAQDLNHDEKTHAKTLLQSAGDQAIRKFVDMVMEKGLQAIEKTPQLIGMLQGVL